MQAAKPRDERRAREIERTRQDILDAAARVFVRGGLQAATMAAIAREAGFTAASLYTYFDSKEAIFRALQDDMRRRMLATFDAPVPAGLTFPQQLELLLQRQLALVTDRTDSVRVFMEWAPARAEDRDARTVFLERASRFLADNGRDELRLRPRVAAEVLYGIFHSRFLAWLLDGEETDPARLAAHGVDVFLHGAARSAPPAGAPPSPTGEPT